MNRDEAIDAGFRPVGTSETTLPDRRLDYDDNTVVVMMRAMLDCPPKQRMDSLVAICKWFVEAESRNREGE